MSVDQCSPINSRDDGDFGGDPQDRRRSDRMKVWMKSNYPDLLRIISITKLLPNQQRTMSFVFSIPYEHTMI